MNKNLATRSAYGLKICLSVGMVFVGSSCFARASDSNLREGERGFYDAFRRQHSQMSSILERFDPDSSIFQTASLPNSSINYETTQEVVIQNGNLTYHYIPETYSRSVPTESKAGMGSYDASDYVRPQPRLPYVKSAPNHDAY
jgi:hypothetical protein